MSRWPSTKARFQVFHGSNPIGTLDWLSHAHMREGHRHPIILAGRTWELEDVDWKGRRVYVVPCGERGRVRWKGSGAELSGEIAGRIRDIILDDADSPRWTTRAKAEMANRRAALRETAEQAGHIFADPATDRVRWCTFAGTVINNLLRIYLNEALGDDVSSDAFELTFPSRTPPAEIRRAVDALAAAEDIASLIPLTDDLLDQLKFSECLPRELAHRAALGHAPGATELARLVRRPDNQPAP